MNKILEANLTWSPPLKSSSPRPPGDGEEQIHRKINEQRYLQESSDTMALTSSEKVKPDDTSASSSIPPYVKWAEGLHHLLNSDTGIQLFQQYLEQEGCGRNGLDFWLACNGIAKACVKEKSLLRIIYNTLVMNLSEISSSTKKDISEKLESNSDLTHHIFDLAWKEVENAIEKTTYPNFLQSDVYISYVQANEENCEKEEVVEETLEEESKNQGSSDSKNGCSNKNQFAKEELLPTLYEDREFVSDSSIPLTRELLQKRAALDHYTFKTKPEAEAGHYLKANTPGYNTAYHAKYSSYLPPSAQDSELQSLSSDAHTDTDKSYTDLSTIDCSEVRPKTKKYERHHRSKPDIILNKGSCAINTLPQMPQRIDEKRIQKAADANSEHFWKELMVKLEDLKRQKEQDEYLQEPQSILDAHVSKFIQSWPGSAQQTPGSYTPPPPQALQMPHPLENVHKSCNLSHNPSYYYKNNNPQYLQQLESVHQHREHDAYSCDSGTVRDYSSDIAPSLGSHSYVPDAQHHHLMSSEQRRRYKEQVKRYTGKKPSHWESQSTFDSGVSLTNVPLPNENQQQKVTDWLGTTQIKNKSSETYESERSLASHHKKSSPPLSPICGQSFKKSSANSSSAGAYSNNSQSHWNAPQANGLFDTVVLGYGFAAMSSAKSPLAQDPNMPMLPSPNAEVTVDECIRRLSAGNSYQRPKSNRSTSAGRNMFESAKTKSFSKGFDSSEDSTLHNRKSGRKSYPNMMPSNFLQSAVDSPKQETKISVAYCFGNGTVPYLSKLSGKEITLRQFKSLISKKGNFKYFFKKKNEELGIVLEEVTEDNEVLPLFEGKIFSVIETID